MGNLQPCPRSKRIDKLKNSNKGIVFEQNNAVEYLGHCNVVKKTMVFGASSIIGSELLSHELFHAYQDQHYDNMGQYSGNNQGKVNIEFEQYVFQSISQRMDGHISLIGSQFIGNSTAKTNFANWINALTNYGTTMPNISDNSDFLNRYSGFLNDYSNFGPLEYR